MTDGARWIQCGVLLSWAIIGISGSTSFDSSPFGKGKADDSSFGTVPPLLRFDFTDGASGDGYHVELSLNASLSHDDFAAGQEVRVKLDAYFSDNTAETHNRTSVVTVDQQNATLVCINATSALQNETAIRDEVESTTGLTVRYFYYVNATTGEYGACLYPRGQNETVATGSEWSLERTTKLTDTARNYVKFNASRGSGMELVVYPRAAETTCANFPVNTSYYFYTQDFGADSYGLGFAGDGQSSLSMSVFATFTAPPFPFIMCFRRYGLDESHGVNSSVADAWLPLYSPSGEWVFAANVSQGDPYAIYYDVPGDVMTPSEFLAMKVYNFRYEQGLSLNLASAIDSSAGDNLKIVPQGWPCTFESDDHPYYGTEFVEASGAWLTGGKPGRFEGSHLGGVGVWGSEGLNPLTGDAAPTADQLVTHPNGTRVQYAVVYVETPSAGAYDVCISLQDDRKGLKGVEKFNFSTPVWRKARRCPATNSSIYGNARCHMSLEELQDSMGLSNDAISRYDQFEDPGMGFDVSDHHWGWSSVDITPGGWGYLRVDTGDDPGGSLTPHRSLRYQGHGMREYFSPQGGDQLRIVPAEKFGNQDQGRGVYVKDDLRTKGFSPFSTGGSYIREDSSSGAGHGSFASVGCWSPEFDRFAEFSSPSPTSTIHLSGDPSDTSDPADRGWAAPGTNQESPTYVASAVFSASLSASVELGDETTRLTVTGSASQWFGFLLPTASGSLAQGEGYALVFTFDAQRRESDVFEYKVTNFTTSTLLARSARVISEYIPQTGSDLPTGMAPSQRVVVVERPTAPDSSDYTAFSTGSTLDLLPNEGSSPSFSGFANGTQFTLGFLPGAAGGMGRNQTTEAFASIRFPFSANSTRFFVCYRPTGFRGWKVLRFHGGETSYVPAKWKGITSATYPFHRELVPGWYGQGFADVRRRLSNTTAFWSLNSTEGGSTVGVSVWSPDRIFSTFPNSYFRAYTGDDAVLRTQGFAVRLVPHHAPCDGLHAIGLSPPSTTPPRSILGGGTASLHSAGRFFSQSMDPGITECSLPDLLRTPPLKDCRGAGHDDPSDAPTRSSMVFHMRLPTGGSAFRVCLRYGGLSWLPLPSNDTVSWGGGGNAPNLWGMSVSEGQDGIAESPRGDYRYESPGDLLLTEPPRGVGVFHADPLTAGNDVALVIQDPQKELALSLEGDGDWFWIAPASRLCTPVGPGGPGDPQETPATPFARFARELAVPHPQLFCDYPGFLERRASLQQDGSNVTSLLNATVEAVSLPRECLSDSTAEGLFCGGHPCDSEPGYFTLNRMSAKSGFPWNSIAPRNADAPILNLERIAGVLTLPDVDILKESGSAADPTGAARGEPFYHPPMKVCYKRGGLSGWVEAPLPPGRDAIGVAAGLSPSAVSLRGGVWMPGANASGAAGGGGGAAYTGQVATLKVFDAKSVNKSFGNIASHPLVAALTPGLYTPDTTTTSTSTTHASAIDTMNAEIASGSAVSPGSPLLKLVPLDPPAGTRVSAAAMRLEALVYPEKGGGDAELLGGAASAAVAGSAAPSAAASDISIRATVYTSGASEVRVSVRSYLLMPSDVSIQRRWFALSLPVAATPGQRHFMSFQHNTSSGAYSLSETTVLTSGTAMAAGAPLTASASILSISEANGVVTAVLRLPGKPPSPSHATLPSTRQLVASEVVIGGGILFDPAEPSATLYTMPLQLEKHTPGAVRTSYFRYTPTGREDTHVACDLHLDRSIGVVTLTIEGPADAWFSIGFGQRQMKGAYAVVVYPTSAVASGLHATGVEERKLGPYTAGEVLPSQMVTLSDSTVGNLRILKLGRQAGGMSASHFSFSYEEPLPYAVAVGESWPFRYHKGMRGSGVMLPAYLVADAGHNMNSPCAPPPGSTSSSPFISSASRLQYGLQDGALFAGFRTVLPSAGGVYAVCLSLNSTGGWRKVGEQRVVDSEARYSIATPGDPPNQGAVSIALQRCSPVPGEPHACDVAGSSESLDLSPEGDRLKVIPAENPGGMDSACHEGSSAEDLAVFGPSEHRGLDLHAGSALRDLGPGDATSKRGEATTTLPASPFDAPFRYKICLFTSVGGAAEQRVWIELKSVSGSPLRTQPAGIDRFAVASFLRLAEAQLGNASATSSAALLGGSALSFEDSGGAVSNGFTLSASREGWPDATLGSAVGNGSVTPRLPTTHLKWVVRKYISGGSWATVPHATCRLAPDSATVELQQEETGEKRIFAPMHVPMQSPVTGQIREYIVCVKPAGGDVWVQLLSEAVGGSTTGGAAVASLPEHDLLRSSGVQAVPNPLGYLVDTASGLLRVFDLADSPSLCNGVRDGCEDFYAITPGSSTCPDTTHPEAYRKLAHLTNFSSSASFPLSDLGQGHRYKVCMYRRDVDSAASTPTHTTLRKPHIAYQMWNTGDVAEGGQSGFFFTTEINSLDVVPLGVSWDSSAVAFVCSSPRCVVPEQAVVHTVDGHSMESRSYVLQQHATLSLQVSLATQGTAAGVGSFPVTLEFCQEPDDPDCAITTKDGSSLFSIKNEGAGGTCSAEHSAAFGWPSDGTTQPLTEGQVTYTLRFLSLCPASKLKMGCGFRFVSLLPNKDYSQTVRVVSPPVWINVFPEIPTGVLVGGGYITPSSRAGYNCTSFRACGALSFHPARHGSRVTAPYGAWELQIGHNKSAVFAMPSSASGGWTAGAAVLQYIPQLAPSVSSASLEMILTLKFNGESPDIAVRWTVLLTRPQVTRIEIVSVTPVWVEGAPVATWDFMQNPHTVLSHGQGAAAATNRTTPTSTHNASGAAGTANSASPATTSVSATGVSFLTALHPYEISLVASDAEGYLPPAAVLDLEFSLTLHSAYASFPGTAAADSPTGEAPPAAGPTGEIPQELNGILENPEVPTALSVLYTSAAYMKAKGSHRVVQSYHVVGREGIGIAVVPLRLRSPLGCARYADDVSHNASAWDGVGGSGGDGDGSGASPPRGLTEIPPFDALREVGPQGGSVGSGAGASAAKPATGCTISMALRPTGPDGGAAQPPVVAELHTPVRGLADALRVEVLGAPHNNATSFLPPGGGGQVGGGDAGASGNRSHTPGGGNISDSDAAAQASNIVTTVAAGLTLWVQPVSVYGGYVDEAHPGSVVVLFAESPALRRTDGSVGPNGTRLLRSSFPFRLHSGKGWGALFTLSLTKPCAGCAFTLHSTGGAAGGVAYYNDPRSGSIGLFGGHLQNITFLGSTGGGGDTATPVGGATATPSPSSAGGAASVPFLRIRRVRGDSTELLWSQSSTFNRETSATEYIVKWVVDGTADPLNTLGFVVEARVPLPGGGSQLDDPYRAVPRNFTIRMMSGQLVSMQELRAIPAVSLSPADPTLTNGIGNGGVHTKVEPLPDVGWKSELRFSKTEDRLCRDCRFEICSTYDDSVYGTILSRDLQAPCIAIRLFATLPLQETLASSQNTLRSLQSVHTLFNDTSPQTAGADLPTTTPHDMSKPLYACRTYATFGVLPVISLRPTPGASAVSTIAYDAAFSLGVFQRGLSLRRQDSPPQSWLQTGPSEEVQRMLTTRSVMSASVTALTSGVSQAGSSSAEAFVISLDGFQPIITGKYAWGYELLTADHIAVSDAGMPGFGCGGDTLAYAHANGAYVAFRPNPGVGVPYASTPLLVGAPSLFSVYIASSGNAPVRSYPSATVMITSRSSLGCGDGGDIEVLALASNASAPNLTHASGFRDAGGGGAAPQHFLRTSSGQLDFWVNYSTPCQACSILVQLCYSHDEVTALNCLIPNAATQPSAADTLPVLGKRTAVSNPFTVQPAGATGISITRQAFPRQKVADDTLLVGDDMQLSLRLTRSRAGWLYDGIGAAEFSLHVVQTADIPISTEPSDGASPPQGDPPGDVLKYAFGGFLGRTHRDFQGAGETSSCCLQSLQKRIRSQHSVDREATTGARHTRYGLTAGVAAASLLSTEETVVSFHFTRPCARCEIWAVVTPAPGSAAFSAQSFRLLADPAALPQPLRVTVRTCGVAWVPQAPLLRVVAKRRPFALQAASTDISGFPSWGFGAHDPLCDTRATPAASNSTDEGEAGDVEEAIAADPGMAFPIWFNSSRVVGSGGGFGGDLQHTNPAPTQPGSSTVVAARSAGRVWDGVAIFRMEFSRTCTRCTVSASFGVPKALLLAYQQNVRQGDAGNRHPPRDGAASELDIDLTEALVMTDTAKLVVIPRENMGERTVNVSGAEHTLPVSIYGADRDGDRSYALGGPSLLGWQRMYFPVLRPPEAGLFLRGNAAHPTSVLLLESVAPPPPVPPTAPGVTAAPQQPWEPTYVAGNITASLGAAVLSYPTLLLQDGLVRAYLPLDVSKPAGLMRTSSSVDLRLGGSPAGDVLQYLTGGVLPTTPPAAAGPPATAEYPFPVELEAGLALLGEPPALVVSPVAEALAVVEPQGDRVLRVTQHRWFTVRLWAVGRDPASDPTTWGGTAFRVFGASGLVWVEKCNAMFEFDGVGQHRAQAFSNGSALLSLRAYSGLGRCHLTFRHESYRIAQLTVEVAVFETSLFHWRSSATVIVPHSSAMLSEPDGNLTNSSDGASAEEGVGRRHTLGYMTVGEVHSEVSLFAANSDLEINELFASDFIQKASVVVEPEGCFVASNNGTPAVASGVVTFAGWFNTSLGVCRFTEVLNLPPGTALSSELRVIPEDPVAVSLREHPSSFGAFPYTGVRRTTLDGLPAVGTSDSVEFWLDFTGTAMRDATGGRAGHGWDEEGTTTGNASSGDSPGDGIATHTTAMVNVEVHTLALASRGLFPQRPYAEGVIAAAQLRVDRERQIYTWSPSSSTRVYAAGGSPQQGGVAGLHNPPVVDFTVANPGRVPPFSQVLRDVGPIYVIIAATHIEVEAHFRSGAAGGFKLALRHRSPVRVIAGQVFDLHIRLADGHGNTADVDGESCGADAVATLRFPTSASACQGAGSPEAHACLDLPRHYTPFSCTAGTATPCHDTAWSVASMPSPLLGVHSNSPFARRLHRGTASFTQVVRDPGVAASGLGSVMPGVSAEALTLSVSGGNDWEGVRGVGDFHTTLRVERLESLQVEGSAGCRTFASSPQESECDLPLLPQLPRVLPQGVGASELPVADKLRKLPRVWISTAQHGYPFDLGVRVATNAGRVAPAHQSHGIRLTVVCVVAAAGTNTEKFRQTLFLGVWDAAVSAVRPAPDPWVVQTAGGKAVFSGVVFQRPCRGARLVFRCVAPEGSDPYRACDGLSMSTELVDAMEPDTLVPTPVPSRGKVDFPVATLVLGVVSSSFAELFAAVPAQRIHSLLVDSLGERRVCRSSTEAGTAFIERQPCDEYLQGGPTRNPSCECRAVGFKGVAPANVSLDWVCLVSRKELEAGAVLPAGLKSQYARCRQPTQMAAVAAANPLLDRHPHILQLSAGMFPVVEFELKLGQPASPTSAVAVTAQAQEALLNADTPMYTELRVFYSKLMLPNVFAVEELPTVAPTPLPVERTATVTLAVEPQVEIDSGGVPVPSVLLASLSCLILVAAQF